VGKTLVVVAIILAAALVVIVALLIAHRSSMGPVVRRRDLKRTREELSAAKDAIFKMKAAADNWHDIDSVLAGEVRRLHDEYTLELRKMEKNT
jgi:hypothetical protein